MDLLSKNQSFPQALLHSILHSLLSNPVNKENDFIKKIKSSSPENSMTPQEILKTLSFSLRSQFNLSIKSIPSRREEGNLWILVNDTADEISKSASSLKGDEINFIINLVCFIIY